MASTEAPLNMFKQWDGNPRAVDNEEHIKRLANSIGELDNGEINLHENLIGVPERNPVTGKRTGYIIVIGGGYRLESLFLLAKGGQIPWSTPVPYKMKDIDIDDPQAIQIALEENMLRLPMDVIDECRATAKLFISGKDVDEIALSFGLSKKTITQRIALGKLPEPAQELIRTGKRTIGWGQALTSADNSMRKKILDEVAEQPDAWKDEAEIRRFVNHDTIPATYAIFDQDQYKSTIVRDMFEGDRLSDSGEFWKLQNAAIEDKRESLLETHAKVVITHDQVMQARYDKATDPEKAMAIIEVSSTGQVTIYEGLAEREDAPARTIEAASDALEAEEDRLPGAILDHARALRTAMAQSAVAGSARLAMVMVVAGLLGHPESPFRVMRAKVKVDPKLRHGQAFESSADNQRKAIDAAASCTSPDSIQDMLSGLDDDELSNLFASLVADRTAFPADARENGLVEGIVRSTGEIRSSWTPSEAYFKALPTTRIRAIALTLVPQRRQKGLLAASKQQLIKVLMGIFDEAQSNHTDLDGDEARAINAWVPDWIAFETSEETADADGFLDGFLEVEAAA